MCWSVGGVQVRQGGLQVPRCVWIVQCSDVLEPAAGVSWDRQPTTRPLRRRHGGHVQRSRHAADPAQSCLQPAHPRRPRLHRTLTQFLRSRPRGRVGGHSWPAVQPAFVGHRRLRPHVLRSRLHDDAPTSHRALPLQVPLVLPRRVSTLRENRRSQHLQIE